ncbi:MAG TPA: tetratricopeptide repeat protein [Bryobacteraceae bacterium]|nr:tetratricopeptide repeat protein [Bryobacteraceae bacterium]
MAARRRPIEAASYLEQVAAASDTGTGAAYRGDPQPDNGYIYRQLGELYGQVGRPDAAAAAMAKAASRLRNNPLALASLYEQQGQLDQAEALYKQTADDSRNPQQASGAWQSLANLYRGEGHPDDAAAAMQQSIATVQLSLLSLAGLLKHASTSRCWPNRRGLRTIPSTTPPWLMPSS